jgi:hypothetical protein
LSIQIIATRLASRYGRGRRTTPFTTLKIAVVAPMPNASVAIATAEAEAKVVREVRHQLSPLVLTYLASIVLAQSPADGVHVAKACRGRAVGGGGGHALRLVRAREHVDVELELLVDVGIDVGSPEAEISSPAFHRRHAMAGAARNTRVTAVE